MEHSKLPWTTTHEEECNGEITAVGLYDNNKNNIMRFSHYDCEQETLEQIEADLDFIVESCNNYEKLQQINKELIEALECANADIQYALDNSTLTKSKFAALIEISKELIAKAKEITP